MLSTRKVCLGLLAVVMSLATSVAPAQDFPTLGGNNARVGHNSNPALFGPGKANLVWFWPNGPTRPGTLIRDNNSNATLRNPTVSDWNVPAIGSEAGYFFQPFRSLNNATLDQAVGAVPFDQARPGGAQPAYEYAVAVPSAPGSHSDPTVPTAGLKRFTWNIDPTVEAPSANPPTVNYQIYAWIPNGPTGPNATGPQFVYPNRFYVFEIIYGNNQRWIDVVDTNVSGQGWVRLGNGGLPTNVVFPYIGGTAPRPPIQVRLYNTQWRDENDQNLEDTTTPRAVYADAVMAVPDSGYITSTPVVGQITTPTGARRQTISAANRNTTGFQNGKQVTVTSAEVNAFYADGTGPLLNKPIWRWAPVDVSPFTTTLDDDPAANVLFWTSETIVNHFGTQYHTAILQGSPSAPNVDYAMYQPTLEDGDYQIQVYVGGNQGPEVFGSQTMVYVWEGANPPQAIPVDQTTPGWVTLSNQRFQHRGSIGENLRVGISNYSPLASDLGKKAYADSVRFIGAFNQTINATPVQTKAFITPNGGGAPVEKDVVVVACDDGHIYCLDANGNGDGTTTLYWAYPSIEPTNPPANWDPNQVAGEDGVGPIAEMPDGGFGLSSPLVQRIAGVDYCFVAAKNGRVYCINMAGRGDANAATGKIGTTSRQWSFPNDYPVAVKQDPLPGGVGGSISYADTAAGPTIFIPATEGRLYAIDAVAGVNKTAPIKWTYPARSTQTLGQITTDPVVDFGKVYFGTARLDDTVPGQFYALDAATGAFVWNFEGDPLTSPADNFMATPATATAAQLGIVNNMVFCANHNLFVYGLDADTGALLWQTNELNTTVSQHLLFTWLTVFDLAGTSAPFPVVMVPTDDGRFEGLFARPADLNVIGGGQRLAYEYLSGSDRLTASMSSGDNFMYGGDMAGNLYAFGDSTGIGGMGTPPGQQGITPNENAPIFNLFRNAKIRMITKAGYTLLRQSDPADVTGDTAPPGVTHDAFLGNPAFVRNLDAFEWGETAYILAYDFPYQTVNLVDGADVTPPIVQFQIGVEGASVRQYGVQAKQFAAQGTPPPDGNGYAILAFPIQGAGPTSIPPGSANVKFSFSTSAGNNVQRVDNITNATTKRILVANPLAIIMPDPTANTLTMGIGNRTFGLNNNPTLPERQANGSPNMPAGGTQGRKLGTTEGVVGNGQTGIGNFWVVDMSMLTLLKGPNRGLEGVRVTRPDLVWQGGIGAVYKAINPLDYPGFEDLPGNFPNTSIDYPNISRAALRGIKDPNGTPENPMVSTGGVQLAPPFPYDENNIQARVTHPVLFQLEVDVPRYQPANNHPNLYFQETGNVFLPSGYLNRLEVYVDSNGNSILDSVSGRREAYRALTNNLAVAIDERIFVTTPTVDLGSLAEGTGYAPGIPGLANGGTALSPWLTGSATFPGATITTNNLAFYNLFKTFKIENAGNVNLLNTRLMKGISGGTAPGPWPIYSNSVDDLGWLDSSQYVFTNFDNTFGLMNEILIQKARVGDRSNTELSTNPIRRYNQNIGVAQSELFVNGPTGDDAAPRIAVAVPIGFPVGLFTQKMSIIENVLNPNQQSLDVDGGNNPLETMSNPSFDLKFGVREFRATGGFSTATAPMVDFPQPAVNAQNLAYRNTQPAAARNTNGSIIVAYTSSQPAYNSPVPTDLITDPAYQIYIATLPGTTPTTSVPPLDELGKFVPFSANQWFRQAVGPFPGAGPHDALFQTGAGETLIPTSVKFGGPALPSLGFMNPFGNRFARITMAFLGTGQKDTSGGRLTEYRIMAAEVAMDAAGAVTITGLRSMPYDPSTQKGRPSVYQVTGGSVIFYSATGTGEGQLFYTVSDGTNFSRPTAYQVGSGFEQVSSPSVQPRGAGTGGLVELTFAGKLRGRSNTEIFYSRSAMGSTNVNGNTVSGTPGAPQPFPSRLKEALTPDTESGTYRAQGVMWATTNRSIPIKVYQQLNGVDVDVEVAGTRTTDRTTGLIRFDTRLGGQCYVDPNLGTVRFASTLPLKSATILLDYTPRILRISQSNVAGHSSPAVLFDGRVAGDVSNYSYWFDIVAGGNLANVSPVATPRSDRYIFTYTRAASGAGQTARPYMTTYRIGVQLYRTLASGARVPTAILTDSAGNIVNMQINGANGPVQVDPAHGRVYFQATQETRIANITFTGVDEAGKAILVPSPAGGYQIGMTPERTESPVPIDQAVNEGAMMPFLDPFELAPRRPGLIWMVYVSTRAGSPDLYFQTMAPRFSPVPNGG